MEIRKTRASVIPLVSGSQQVSAKQTKALQSANMASQPNVSQDCRLTEQGREALKHTSDFDAEKVAALRQSLKNGTFDMDFGLITEAILRQHG